MKLTRNKLKFIDLLGLGIATISNLAYTAEDFSYTYPELDYINLNIDLVGDSGSVLEDLDNGGGWGARGAFAIAHSWFVFAIYSITEADKSFIDDQNQFHRSNTDINRWACA